MAIADARVRAYTNLFKAKIGDGPIGVFQRLHRYQSGKGFGDFCRGVLRRILPIPISVGKSALSAMSDSQDHGASFPDLLKSALRLSTKAEIHGTLNQIEREQQSSGLKRKRHKSLYNGHKAKRRKLIIKNF